MERVKPTYGRLNDLKELRGRVRTHALRVDHQKARIAELERKGRDIKAAKHELQAMESTQRVYENDLENITRQIHAAMLDTISENAAGGPGIRQPVR